MAAMAHPEFTARVFARRLPRLPEERPWRHRSPSRRQGHPGPHNWLEYISPPSGPAEGGITSSCSPRWPNTCSKYGFKTKDEVYEWLYKKSFMTVGEYRTHSWPDIRTNAWIRYRKDLRQALERASGRYMVPAVDDPRDSCIIVTGGGEEFLMWSGGGFRVFGLDCYGVDVALGQNRDRPEEKGGSVMAPPGISRDEQVFQLCCRLLWSHYVQM